MLDKAHLMRRAWSLFRQSMASFTRLAFATCLRRAWHEAKNAPVTPWEVLQRYVSVARGSSRAEVIRHAEFALSRARATMARYKNAPEPRSTYSARKRSTDTQRLGALESIVAAEKTAAGIAANYTAKREGDAFVLKRNGAEFGRLVGSGDALTFISPDAALAERVRGAVVAWWGVPAALAKIRAADEALRLSRAS